MFVNKKAPQGAFLLPVTINRKALIMEMLGFAIMQVVFAGIGWLCLYAWYWDQKKVSCVVTEKYYGSYSGAGKVLILNFVAGTGAAAMIGMVLYVLFRWIYQSITGTP